MNTPNEPNIKQTGQPAPRFSAQETVVNTGVPLPGEPSAGLKAQLL